MMRAVPWMAMWVAATVASCAPSVPPPGGTSVGNPGKGAYRLAPPTELEDPRPPRFAQLVGLLVVGAGLLFAALGFPAGVPIAAAVALVAAFLNSAFGLCLGCELYLLQRRLAHQN